MTTMRLSRAGLLLASLALSLVFAIPTLAQTPEKPADAPKAPTTQPTPPEAQELLDIIGQVGQGNIDFRDQRAVALYNMQLQEALKAMATLQSKFPEVAKRTEVRQAELAMLAESAMLANDTDMPELRKKIAQVLADKDAPRALTALARYHELNADLARRRVKEPATQPDQMPSWLNEELDRRIDFAKKFKDQPIAKEAYGQALIFKANLNGYDKTTEQINQFFTTFPEDKDLHATFLARLAMELYSANRDGWDKAKPVADRLLADYPDQKITPEVLGRLALGRIQADPKAGEEMLTKLTEKYPGNNALAEVWGQLVAMAYRAQDTKLMQQRLAVLANKFPKADARANVLAGLAYAEFQEKGLDAAKPTLETLQKELPDAEILPRLMIALAQEHLRNVGYEKAAPFVDEVIKKHGQLDEAQSLVGMVGRYKAVGQPVQMQFTSIDGKKVSLAELKGKVVVVYFWATWCQPCVQGMEKTIGIADQYAKQGVQFLGVSLDEDQQDVVDFQKSFKQPWPNVVGEQSEALAKKWGVATIPTFLVIDAQGKLVNAGVSDKEQLHMILERLLSPSTQPDKPAESK